MTDTKSQSVTRDRILDVAERLFMESGYEGTSMRTITGEAAVNLAAVNYHFGSKEALLREVFRRRLTWLNHERLKALDALEAQGGAVKPSAILEAFFGTLLRMGAEESLGGMTFLRLLGRTLTNPAGCVHTFFTGEYAEVIERYKRALFQALPEVPEEEIIWRFHLMFGAMSYAIAGTNTLHVVTGCKLDIDNIGPDTARILEARVMPFLLGGLRAPLPLLAAGHA